jgi:hypothetical protein
MSSFSKSPNKLNCSKHLCSIYSFIHPFIHHWKYVLILPWSPSQEEEESLLPSSTLSVTVDSTTSTLLVRTFLLQFVQWPSQGFIDFSNTLWQLPPWYLWTVSSTWPSGKSLNSIVSCTHNSELPSCNNVRIRVLLLLLRSCCSTKVTNKGRMQRLKGYREHRRNEEKRVSSGSFYKDWRLCTQGGLREVW